MPAQSRRSRSSTTNSRFYLRVDAPHRLDWNTFPSFVRFAGPHHPYNSPPLLFLERVYIPAAATVPGPVFVARRFRQRFCVIVAAHLFFLSVGLTNSRILFAFRVCPFFSSRYRSSCYLSFSSSSIFQEPSIQRLLSTIFTTTISVMDSERLVFLAFKIELECSRRTFGVTSNDRFGVPGSL